MQPRKLVQCAGWHDNLSAMVYVIPLRARHHHHWVAAVELIEAAGSTGMGVSVGGMHEVIILVVVISELSIKLVK
jgi:hypothetical protein